MNGYLISVIYKPYQSLEFQLNDALVCFATACSQSLDRNYLLSMAHDLLSQAECIWFRGRQVGYYSDKEAYERVFGIFNVLKENFPKDIKVIYEAINGVDINQPKIPTDSMFGSRCSRL